MNKRALLIAFHFPPQAASSGIQRTLSFSKHLGRHGWEPLVMSASPRAYGVQNPSQLASVPAGLVVRRPFALDAKRHLGIRGRYPEVLALPDRWVSWLFSAVPCGLALVRRYRPQVIWSTFPIATSHLIGLALHRLTGLPWVADFRDPMLQAAYPTSRAQRRIYGWIERETVRRCQAAVFTTQSAMESYRQRFPDFPPDKFSVIENGYDDEAFNVAPPARAATPGARPLTLVHSGVLYQTGRDPSPFLQAIADLKKAGRIDAAALQVVLRAPGDMDEMGACVRRFGVEDIVQVAPPVPYAAALGEMLDADGLIVFQGTPFNTQIPAKIYEYFRARKPVLALVDPAGETAKVLRAAGFDALADIGSPGAIAPVLERFVAQVGDGSAFRAGDELVASSSRAHRARQLADVLERAILDLDPATSKASERA